MFRFCDGEATDATGIDLQNLNVQQPLDAHLYIALNKIPSSQLPILVAPLCVEVSGCFKCQTEIRACLKLEHLTVHRIISVFLDFGVDPFGRVYLIKKTLKCKHINVNSNTSKHLGLLL